MIICIIAGGSGTRLWPLSTPEFPKQLLSLNGEKDSLLQLTYNRARKITSKILIVTENSHIHHVKKQLRDLPDSSFIVEPARKGTANCIVQALVHINKNYDHDEPIAFIHSDHYIRDNDGFVKTLKDAEYISRKNKKIILIGVEPDFPSTGFGYIERGDIVDAKGALYKVSSFKEKPDLNTALKYLKSGRYLWNCGYFVGSYNVFESKMSTYSPDLNGVLNRLKKLNKDEFNKQYLALSSDAIDYALIEKVKDLEVIPAQFDWMDLGSYKDLAKAADVDEKGNYINGEIFVEEVENSYVVNKEDKPIVVIGVNNLAIINSKEGILITRKDLSQKVGDISKEIKKGN
jgi:hypothetical protein